MWAERVFDGGMGANAGKSAVCTTYARGVNFSQFSPRPKFSVADMPFSFTGLHAPANGTQTAN